MAPLETVVPTDLSADTIEDADLQNDDKKPDPDPKSSGYLSNPSELGEIRDMLRFIVDNMKEKANEADVEDEWKALAMVLDRIFFWITSITALILIPAFLLKRTPSHQF